jgi:hypothetical protein
MKKYLCKKVKFPERAADNIVDENWLYRPYEEELI